MANVFATLSNINVLWTCVDRQFHPFGTATCRAVLVPPYGYSGVLEVPASETLSNINVPVM